MFFLAATLVGRIEGDFVYRKVAANNVFVVNNVKKSMTRK